MKWLVFVLVAAALLMAHAGTSMAGIAVDLELVLAADVSGSLDANDFALQRDGYASAFQSAQVHNALQGKSIAVTLVYWSTGQDVAVPWTLITDAASSNAFAAAITAAPRPSSGSTYLADAMNYSAGLFGVNGYDGDHLVLDVSGDGADTPTGYTVPVAPNVQAARDAFLGGGANRTINALWIDDRDYFGDDPADIINALDYGQTNVIGGPGAFQDIVQNFDQFAAAVTEKIGKEIEDPGGVIPEPSTFIVWSLLGALGMTVGWWRRRS